VGVQAASVPAEKQANSPVGLAWIALANELVSKSRWPSEVGMLTVAAIALPAQSRPPAINSDTRGRRSMVLTWFMTGFLDA
jgi:hypothetical protein